MQTKHIVCFGEILWDVLPTSKKPGGAPMNVAYHLHQLGLSSTLISRIGRDAAGEELLAFLKTIGLSDQYIQVDETHDTSTVQATVGDDNEVSYDIVAPVAWDFLANEDQLSVLVEQADVLVYGSLASRGPVSRSTLLRLIDAARYRLFDANLREPHYTRETLDLLLGKADTLKLNASELSVLSGRHPEVSVTEEEAVRRLQERYDLAEVIVTKGAEGASYYTGTGQYHYPALPVVINDTVGSGDSFLAAFLAQKMKGKTGYDILKFATALAGYVTTQAGACPPYEIEDIEEFMAKGLS